MTGVGIGGRSGSHAPVVGVDKYAHAPPLEHAVHDAQAVAKIPGRLFSFKNDALLLNDTASKSNVLSRYAGYEKIAADPDSRQLVFSAGHGRSASRWPKKKAMRGEVE